MSAVAEAPAQPSLRRMRRFDIRPDRDLGQNFLVDSNILGVIGRASELHPEDVVLEIGGGLGVLSEYLAPRVAHVHVVEIDQRLREALLDATGPHENVTVHWDDAMTLELQALSPQPNKVVANLPYGIAAGVLLRTIEQLGSVQSWVAMVQREVGERLAGSPGSGSYGTPSVLAQLECRVQVLRAIPRGVFFPVPNVDSVLLGMQRLPLGPGGANAPVTPALRRLVAGSFAHRRKTLAGSVALTGAVPGRSRQQIRAALQDLGHPADARAERLRPVDFRSLLELLAE